MTAALAVSDTALVAVLALPHALYACIWLRPAFCRALCGAADAVDVFCAVATALKVLQFATLYAWTVRDAPLTLEAVSGARWAVSLGLLAVGQALNLGVYAALGKRGVYYGPKLGHAVPWCTGFPFNLGVRHPQYIGSVLSVWAFLALLWGSGRPSLLPVCGAWTGLYAATAWVEESL